MLAQILSSQARETIVENIHDYLMSGMAAALWLPFVLTFITVWTMTWWNLFNVRHLTLWHFVHRTDKQLRLTSILPATTICSLSSSNRPLIDHHVWLTSREIVRSCVADVYRGREDVNSGARGREGRARRVNREHELQASLQALTISPSSRARVPSSPSPINACHAG